MFLGEVGRTLFSPLYIRKARSWEGASFAERNSSGGEESRFWTEIAMENQGTRLLNDAVEAYLDICQRQIDSVDEYKEEHLEDA
jgi:hypothetical protein